MSIVIGVLLTALAGQARAEIIHLKLGQSPVVRTLNYDPGRGELAPGGDRFVGVDISGRKLTVAPLAIGRATLTVTDSAGKLQEQIDIVVTSVSKTTLDVVESIKALLIDDEGRPIPTLKVDAVPNADMARVTGSIGLRRDVNRMGRAKEMFGSQLVDLTQTDPSYFDKVTQEIKVAIANPNIDVTRAGDTLFLSGMAFTEGEKIQVEAMARALYPQLQSFVTVRPAAMEDVLLQKPLIQVECQIMEIMNDAAKNIGINWATAVPVTLAANYTAGGSGSVSLDTKQLMNSLLPLVNNGSAKVLYTQNLVCENGEQSKFFAGGSFYIVAYAPSTLGVETKEVEYGVGMELAPKADKQGNIETVVNIEFSNLGPTINNMPSIMKRYVKTSVNVKHGQTLSLGALMGTDTKKDTSKIPALGDIPVLGELFKSKNYQEGKSEMVIFITPRLVVPGSVENTSLRTQVQTKVNTPK